MMQTKPVRLAIVGTGQLAQMQLDTCIRPDMPDIHAATISVEEFEQMTSEEHANWSIGFDVVTYETENISCTTISVA